MGTRAIPGLILSCLVILPAAGAVPGDYDGDGRVDLTDATRALQAALGAISPSPAAVLASDLDADRQIDIIDATGILQIAIGLRPPILGTGSPALPPVELRPENQAVSWDDAAGAEGTRDLWGVIDSGALVVARPEAAGIRLERIVIDGPLPGPDGRLAHATGRLTRDGSGLAHLVPSGPGESLALPLPARIISPAQVADVVAPADLGSISLPLYASVTAARTRSPGWTSDIVGSLQGGKPLYTASSPDGRTLAIIWRGPRLPPDPGIVYRYLRIITLYDCSRQALTRVLADIEGWVEE